MRILLASNYYPEHMGGIETVAANLYREYSAAGHQVTWMAADVRDRPHAGDSPLRAWNVTERRFGFPYPIPGLGSLRRVRPAVAAADVLHLHDSLYAANVRAFVAARRRRRPVLLTQHVGPIPLRSRLLRGVQTAAYASLGRSLLSGADQVTFVSREVMAHFAARVRFRRPPVLVPNGVDVELFHPLSDAERANLRPDGRRLVLFAGRLVRRKGLHWIREVAARRPEWRFVLAGRPGDVNPAAWELKNVAVLPAQPQAELHRLYAAADVLLLPSSGEGFPVSVQEAMSSGTPAVVAEELAAQYPAPGLVGSRLDPAALVEAVEQAAAADRHAASEFARTTWSWAVAAARYLELMQGISP